MPNRYLARVYVRLKPGYSDPEGETTAGALRGLGYDVEDVRVSKVYEILFKAEDRSRAGELVEEMCRRLLTNPTKDDYTYELREME